MSTERATQGPTFLGRLVRWVVFGGVLFGLGYWVRDRQPESDGPARAQVRALRAQVPWVWRWIESSPRAQAMLPREVVQRAVEESLKPVSWRLTAVQRLERLGTNAWGVVPELVSIVDGSDLASGIAAAEALARIQAEESPGWRAQLTLWDGKVRASRVFGHLLTGRNSLGRRYDEVHRRFALMGLEATGPAGSDWREAVAEVATSAEEPAIRAQAAAALGRVAPKHVETVAVLKKLFENEKEWPEVRAVALANWAGVQESDPKVEARVRQALDDSSGHVRLAAVRVLWQKGVPVDEILPTLSGLTQHRLASIRVMTVKMATEMGRLAGPIRGDIERLEEDPEESVQAAVAEWRLLGDRPAVSRQGPGVGGGFGGVGIKAGKAGRWVF